MNLKATMAIKRIAEIGFLITLCLTLLPGYLSAQINPATFKFQHLNKELNNNQVFSICEDRYGYLWIGTLSGLHRYDGEDFEVYFTSNDTASIQENRIETILEDTKGNLWIGTYDGICRFNRDQNNFIRYKTESDLTNPLDPNTNRIREIVEDDNGRIWVASQRNGLFYFDENQQTFVPFSKKGDDLIKTTHLSALCKGRNNVLWVGTVENGLIKLDVTNHKASHYRPDPNDPESLADRDVSSIVIDKDNVLWIGLSFFGVDRLVEQDQKMIFKHYRYDKNNPATLANDFIKALYVDKSNRLWSCNENGGMNLYDPGIDNFIRFKPDPLNRFGVYSTSYWCASEDTQGRLWLGSSLDGIDVWDKYLLKFNLHQKSTGGLTNNIVRAFFEDRDGNLWLATDGGGLNFLDRESEKFSVFQHDPANQKTIRSNSVLAICEDNDGLLWIGTWQGGINLLDRKKKTFTSFEPDNANLRSVFNIVKDKEGNLWICTYDGGVSLFNWKTKTLRTYRNEPNNAQSLSNNIVPVILEDTEGNIWFGTEDSGLNLLKRAEIQQGIFQRFLPDPQDSASLPAKLVNHIFEDSRKNIWLATGGGLSRYIPESGTFKTYTSRHGLPTDHVKSIAEDNHGHLWLGTVKGITKFDPLAGIAISNYDSKDGLQRGEFSRYSVYKTRKGELLFGGSNGYNSFIPDSVQNNPFAPKIYLTGLKIFNKPISSNDTDSVLPRHIMELDAITLSHEHSVFTLDFIAINFTHAEKNQYAYRLEGLEKDWNYVGNQHSATYTNLDPGEYFFHVKASNNDGVWNEEGRIIRIVITPPYWKTWWFKAIIAIVILVGIYLVVYLRITRLRKKNTELETKVNERTAQLKELVKELQQKQDEIETTNEELTSTMEDLFVQKNHVELVNNKLKQTHEELVKTNNELDERVQERTTKLVKANQELDRFVYSASHDLSAPLKSILGLIQLTKIENKSNELQFHLDHMQKSVMKLEGVIKSLTQFSRNMGHKIMHQEFKFGELVDEVLDELKYPFHAEEISIIKKFGNDDILKSDYLRVKIILTNLISNSFKYRNEQGNHSYVEIGFSQTNGYAIIEVKDNGIGISRENQDKVFNMFYRATDQSKGSGLGLYIVKETVEKLEGEISIQSELGQFTIFTVKLKLH
ncbi:MAG TPA: two-component regulator propeller domain-containing protein [Ohtaekwangia sp.]